MGVMSGEYRVALVVDPCFGVGLEELARGMHVWAVRSADNERVVRRIWENDDGARPLETGVTLFDSPDETPEEACKGIIETVELHHGEYSHNPAVTAIEVFGVQPTRSIREEFAAHRFDEVTASGDSFVASRRRL